MVRAEFKHLKPDEKAIAERFKSLFLLVGEYEYDIHLDVPDVKFPDYWTKKDIQHWSGLRAKRIDLVIHQPDRDWVIEITPKLSKAAIGGVEVYRDLYKKQFHPRKEVRVGVICEVDDQAYREFCKDRDIAVWVV